MERKEQDLLLNMIGNPTSSIQDLMKSGLSVLNTSLENKDTYQKSVSIQENPNFKGTDGQFDPSKLDNSYKAAVMAYNYMSEDQLNKYIMDSAKYSSQNIFAPIKQRDYSQGFVYHKMENPNRITRGLIGVGRNSTPEFSESELAQEQEVVDWKTGKKLPKPNGNWIHYLTDTLVLAQYDKDVDINGIEEGQPGFDKNNIAHVKGERKLNENGTYYYETLGGRDVTGRRVLWKGDTLTTDGSWANRHLDFFDSDDIDQNSGGKTVLKNLALVGSMFIPGVGEYVALTSAALQTAGLFGTMGRMFTGDSSEFARNLEGWGQSINRQSGRTEAAVSNPWSMESFLNLAADVVAQLREQRAVFKLVPRLFNKGGISEDYLKELENQYVAELNSASKVKFDPNTPINLQRTVALQKELQLANQQKAAEMVRKYTENYYNLGGDISKVYMTGITVQNAYGEAIQQGADPLSALLYTLGYSWGEWKILNTGIGEWILPELRMQSAEHKQIIKTVFSDLLKNGEDMTNAVTKAEKNKLIHKIVNLGKQVAHTDYSVTKGMLGNTMANALGEGVEEVSEEFLADISKQAYNLVSWFTGNDVQLDAWKDMGNRYALSFLGGALGGSLAGIGLDNLRYAHALRNMTTEQATQKLVAISRDPEQRSKFIENLEKMDLGASHLSAKEYETDENGKFIGWKPGTANDNQDKFAKDIIKQQLNFIDNILEANGGKLKDESVLKDVIQDVRFAYLTQTNAGNRVISRYNTIMSKIVEATQKLKNINSPQNQTVNGDKDQKGEESPTTENQRKQVEEELKQLIKEKDDLLSGKYSAELALESLIELNPYVMDKLGGMSAIRYAETRTGMSYDKIPDNLKDKYLADFKNIAETNGKDTVALLSQAYLQLSNTALPAMQQVYELLQNPQRIEIAKLARGLAMQLDAFNTELQMNGSEAFLSTVQQEIDNLSVGEKSIMTLMEGLYTPEQQERLTQMAEEFRNAESEEEKKRLTLEHNKEYIKTAFDTLLPLIEQTIETGYLDSTTRQMLSDAIDVMIKNIYSIGNRGAVLYQLRNKLQDVSQVKHTPIEQVLDKFIIDANLSDIRFTGLVDTLYKLYNDVRKDITQFLPSENQLERIGEAIQLLDLFEGIVYGARTDQLGIDVLQDSGTRETKVNENYFGINGIVKNLAETYGADDLYKALPTIDGRLADQLMQDIGTIKKQLTFYYDLMSINSGQKLSKQSRVETNLSYLLYKAVKNFVITIPDDWKDKDKLEGVINGMVFTEQNYLSDKKALTEEDQITLEKEKLSMMQGLHEFFKTNQDKVDNVDELAKLLSADNILLTDGQIQTLTENTTQLDGHIYISWLASIAALDPTLFYGNYRNVIESDIAPVPGQEMGIYLASANILNGGTVTKFIEATQKSLYNYFINQPDKEKQKKLFEDFGFPIDKVAEEDWPKVFNNTFYPIFKNTVLIEGIPGSGKTKAVLEVTNRILKSNPEISGEVLKTPWFVHTSSKKAENLSSDENESNEFFGHQDLIQRISNWNKQITEDSYYFDETGVIRPKVEFKHLDKLPSVIFIDEVSKYNLLEMKVIDEFAQTHGIPIIVLGDFDQSPERLNVQVPFKGREPGNMKLQLYRTTFFSPIKLGDSFRTTNNQKEKNLAALQVALESDSAKNIPLHYHYDKEKGLFGDLIYDRVDAGEDVVSIDTIGGNDKPSILDVIKTMLATTDEKIGFIYSDEDGILASELLKPEYADKIIPYKNNFAQGDEAKYFIIESPYNKDLDFNDFYTGITRSSQGTLVYFNAEDSIVTKSDDSLISFYTISDKVTYDSSLPGQSIAAYSEKRKQRLEKIYEGKEVGPLTLTKRSEQDLGHKELPKTTESSLDPVTDGELETSTVVLTNGFTNPKELAKAKKTATEQGNSEDVKAVVHDENEEIVIDLALYSHASSEVGLNDWTEEGLPIWDSVPKSVRNNRLDSVWGLEKLHILPDNAKKSEYIKILDNLRSILLSYRKKSDIETDIGDILNLNSPYVTFAIKNSANPTTGDINVTNSDYDRFSKRTNEQLEDVFIRDERAHEANRRQLIAIIGNNDEDVLEIPLGTITSPITLINSDPVFEEELHDGRSVKKTFWDAFNRARNPYDGVKAVIDAFENVPRYKQLITLCKLWINTGNVIGYIENTQWTPINNLKNEGGQVDQKKGMNQARMEILQYDASDEDPIPLVNYAISPTFTISDVIIPKRTLNKNGRQILAGHPIILWTSNSLIPKENLESIFMDETTENPDVKFAYVNLPDFTITEYLNSLFEFTKNGTIPVGNIFTSYQIISELMGVDGFQEVLEALLPISGTDVYNTLKTVIEDINESVKPDTSIADEKQRRVKYNQELKNKLFSSSDLFEGAFWQGHNQSIASQFQNVLIKITQNINRTDGNQQLIEKNVKKLEALAGNRKIIDQVRPKEDWGESGNFMLMNYDQSKLEVHGKQLTISSKLTSKAFLSETGDMNPDSLMGIITHLVEKVFYNNADQRKSKHNRQYINRKSKLSETPETSLIDEMNDSIAKLGLPPLEESGINLEGLTESEILESCALYITNNSNNQLAIPFDDDLLLIEVEDKNNDVTYEIVKTDTGYNFNDDSGELVYKLTISDDLSTVQLEEPKTEEVTKVVDINGITLEELQSIGEKKVTGNLSIRIDNTIKSAETLKNLISALQEIKNGNANQYIKAIDKMYPTEYEKYKEFLKNVDNNNPQIEQTTCNSVMKSKIIKKYGKMQNFIS